MANNDVKDIYRAVDELNKRVDKLSKQSTLEQRVQTLEKEIKELKQGQEIISGFLTSGLRPLIKIIHNFPTF
jgi:cell division protein FtsB